MTNHRNRFPTRRRFLKQSAALSAGAAALAVPLAGSAAVFPASDTVNQTGSASDSGQAGANAPSVQTPLPSEPAQRGRLGRRNSVRR